MGTYILPSYNIQTKSQAINSYAECVFKHVLQKQNQAHVYSKTESTVCTCFFFFLSEWFEKLDKLNQLQCVKKKT